MAPRVPAAKDRSLTSMVRPIPLVQVQMQSWRSMCRCLGCCRATEPHGSSTHTWQPHLRATNFAQFLFVHVAKPCSVQITAQSTLSQVPASVRVKRDAGQQRAGQGLIPARNAAPPMAAGFGLAPEPAPRRQEAAAAGSGAAAARPGAAGGLPYPCHILHPDSCCPELAMTGWLARLLHSRQRVSCSGLCAREVQELICTCALGLLHLAVGADTRSIAAGLAARKPAPRPEDDKFMQFMADMQQLGAIS